jgi:hypothetical protein
MRRAEHELESSPPSQASHAIEIHVPGPQGGAPQATFTIPLRISIRVGTPERVSPATTPASVAPISAEAAAAFDLRSLLSTAFSWPAAYSLALASKLSYDAPEAMVATARSTWGFAACRTFEAGDTQCFIASTATHALIAFRGTESVGDWLADLDARSLMRPYGAVHRGFYHAFRDIEPALSSALASLSARRLLLTGHSLGGALATICAAEWQATRDIAAVYTYGQPRCGNQRFREFLNARFGDAFSRFVNDDDIVPRVPPGFRHVGHLFHFDATGNLQNSTESIAEASEGTEAPPLTNAEFDALRAQLLAERQGERLESMTEAPIPAPELEGFFPSFRDHRLDGYLNKIRQQL